ncbi:MAG: amidohydrolase [Sphingomonadales bacterium]
MKTFLLGLLVFFLAACGEAGTPETSEFTVFMNATVYTGVENGDNAEAVVTNGNRIVFVGSETAALELAPNARMVNLNGAFMYPGFSDGHAHLLGIGQRELVLNLEGSISVADVQERLRAYAEIVPEGENIVGRGWIETHWPEGRFLTREDIDAVVPDRPVYLGRSDGHAATLNTAALEMLGIDENTPVPDGGEILRNEKGELTGVIIDAAKEGPESFFYSALNERRAEAYDGSSQFLASHGWTQIHNMWDTQEALDLMETASDEGWLKVRVYNSLQGFIPGSGPNPSVYEFLKSGARVNQNGKVITRAIKLYMDGALGSRGALLLEPYSDADTKGLLLADEDIYLDIMGKALRAGIQVNIHAIGDGGNRLLLDWVQETFEAVPAEEWGNPDPRWRDEHTQIVNPEDIPRFAELGVIPSMQPSHAIGDLYFAPDRLGKDRLVGAYAWRSLIEAGSIIVGGSDAPVERGDPRIEFYAAVARKSLDGFSNEDWHPEEAVTRAEALKMFTIWPAYAAFQEKDLGTIEVGKLADFTVFSADIMTIPEADILTVEVIMTIVDGEIVYENPGS